MRTRRDGPARDWDAELPRLNDWRKRKVKRWVEKLKRKSHRRTRYKAAELAEAFDVTENTVRRWVAEGKVPAERTPARFWFNDDSVRAVLKLGYNLRL